MRPLTSRIGGALAILCAVFATGQTLAQASNYPNHSIRLVVPYSPGGNIDITARVLSVSLGEALGQAVVVENRPGAGGLLGAGYVTRVAPDGYTLLLGSTGSLTTAPAVYRNVPFDPIKDFKAIGGIQTVPLVLTTSKALPVNNFAELLAYSKSHGAVNVGVTGLGSLAHLALLLIDQQTGLQTLNVPYAGSGPAMTDLMGNHVSVMVDQLNSSLPYIQHDQVKVMVQLGKTRSPLLPNVPTLAEQGDPGFEAVTFTGLFAPARLSPEIEKKLVAALARALADPNLRKRFKDMGADVMDTNQPAFARFVAGDLDKWKKVSREAKITVE